MTFYCPVFIPAHALDLHQFTHPTSSLQAVRRFHLKPGSRVDVLQKTLCKYEVSRRRWEGESGPAELSFSVSGDRQPFYIQMKHMQVRSTNVAHIYVFCTV